MYAYLCVCACVQAGMYVSRPMYVHVYVICMLAYTYACIGLYICVESLMIMSIKETDKVKIMQNPMLFTEISYGNL